MNEHKIMDDLAEAAGIAGGQGRSAGEVYANGTVTVWACALIAAALFAVLACVLWNVL